MNNVLISCNHIFFQGQTTNSDDDFELYLTPRSSLKKEMASDLRSVRQQYNEKLTKLGITKEMMESEM